MRKADYQTLAAIIADEIRSGETWLTSDEPEYRTIGSARVACAKRLAHQFAARIRQVAGAEFLKACGIKP